MDEKYILAKLSDTITERPKVFKIMIAKPSFIEKILFLLRVKKREVVFHVKPQPFAKLAQMAPLLISFENDLLKVSSGEIEKGEWYWQFIRKHSDALLKVISIALSDQRFPPAKLVDFLKNNCTIEDIMAIVKAVVADLNINPFFNTIDLLTGINVLESKSSPKEVRETIAPTEHLETA